MNKPKFIKLNEFNEDYINCDYDLKIIDYVNTLKNKL